MEWEKTVSPHFVFTEQDTPQGLAIDMDTPPQVGEHVALKTKNIGVKAKITEQLSEHRYQAEVTEISQDDKPLAKVEGISKGHKITFDFNHIVFLYRTIRA